MESRTFVPNWTRWEPIPSPEDEFWYWERISPEFWFWLRDVLFWLPVACSVGYYIGIYKLHNYMKKRPTPVECKGYRVLYNVLVTWASFLIAYKAFLLMPMPNLLTSEGLYTALCVRRPLKSVLVTYTGIGLWLRLVHFLDTVFIILDKKPIPSLQMFHHTLAVLIPTILSPYEEPFVVIAGEINAAHHCIVYLLSTLKALGMKLPKLVSMIMLASEGGIMLLFCFGSLYTANIIQQGGKCHRHPTSALIFNFVVLLFGVYVAKVFIDRFVIKSKSKAKQT